MPIQRTDTTNAGKSVNDWLLDGKTEWTVKLDERWKRESLRLHTPGRHPWLSPPASRNSRDVVVDTAILSRIKLQDVFWGVSTEHASQKVPYDCSVRELRISREDLSTGGDKGFARVIAMDYVQGRQRLSTE
ncbi:hypothetical protein M405DRAFT_838489 [Rhizopogon salebrosus TDB-379]|nr:hypothetical protein M405DRAFT_838489 [Rhizopogon salebrosus TDB-379]